MTSSPLSSSPHFARYQQNARSVYDSITTNDLLAIRSIFTPLTLRDRKLICYLKINMKSLLYYACELGFYEIVKFLIDECGADLDDGYYTNKVSLPIMQAALVNFHLPLMNLLRRRGFNVMDDRNEDFLSHYAFENGYFSSLSILKLYKKRANITSTGVWEKERNESRRFFFTWISELAFQTRNIEFLMASKNGNTEKMKLLMRSGIDKYCTNSEEQNALCVAILNNQKNSVNFLINSQIYSLKSYVLALEFSGAVFIVLRSKKQEGLHCWKESLRIRREFFIGFADQRTREQETDMGLKFETENDIDNLQEGLEVYFQALKVFCRHLSMVNKLLHEAFVTVAELEDFGSNLVNPLIILAELYNFPNNNRQVPISPPIRAIESMKKLYRSRFYCNTEDETTFLCCFENLFNFLKAEIWKGLLRCGTEFYRIAYGELIELALTCIASMNRYDLSKEKKIWIKHRVEKSIKMYSYPYPTTLMHRAINRDSPFPLVRFLLQCSADANGDDSMGNTPLHSVSLLPTENPYLHCLVRLLTDAGGHIDSMNQYGIRPQSLLLHKDIIKNPLHFLSLQCLAAQVISKHNIPITDETYPKILVNFVRLHSVLPI